MEDIRGVRLRKFKLRKIVLGVRMHFRHKTLYFTHMPRSPQWMDLYQIWFRARGSFLGRYQLCGILLQSIHGFRFCQGSKFAISH